MVTPGASLTIPLVVNYRQYSWNELVHQQWGSAWSIPEVVYEMNNGKQYKSTDMTTDGVYSKT
jgi:hypothetical protein